MINKECQILFLFLLTNLCAQSQGVYRTMLRLPDTGETTSYTNTFGEDADFVYCHPSFILNGDGTVTDTITTLMWQQSDGGEMTIEDAFIYADTLTLAGYTDWRLPNAHEGFSILNHQFANPAIDNSVFAPSNAEYWWTNIYQANDSSKVWVTNSGGGVGNHPKSETISAGGVKRFHTRVVRDVSAPVYIQSRFSDNGDGTVTDNLTNLSWQKAPFPDSLTWENSLTMADTLSLGGYNDWRLPNIKELQSLNDETLMSPSVDQAYFSVTGNQQFWSSTTLPNQTSKAWYLDTHFGITTYDQKTARHLMFAVRGDENIISGVSHFANSGSLFKGPNPFETYIRLSDECNGVNCVLTDMEGREVYCGKDLSDRNFNYLTSGIYFLTVQFEIPVTLKIVKE